MLDGYSVIVDPEGTILAGPLVREEGILYATLDLDAARARRRLFDPVGHYNRPDVFRLVVDDRRSSSRCRMGVVRPGLDAELVALGVTHDGDVLVALHDHGAQPL
jgi:hypothetical protein